MRKCKFKNIVILDFIITLILCIMSFLSEFYEQFIAILLISFFSRFVFGYLFFSIEEDLKEEKQK